MIVQKFGGGCLRDGACFRRVIEIIQAEPGPVLAVVSAVQGVTDTLAEAADAAVEAEAGIPAVVERLRRIHQAVLAETVADPEIRREAEAALERKLARLERLLIGVHYTSESSGYVRADILSHGERLSAIALSAALRSAGVRSEVWEADEIGLTATETPDHASADVAQFKAEFEGLAARAADAGVVPVITGFFGRTPSGRIATFGRNASDYSAAVIACAAGARRLEVWKDVDGFMTADPKSVPAAVRLPRLSRAEAAELCYFGARILHPRALEPLSETAIEIAVRAFDNPGSPGTLITADDGGRAADGAAVKSVTVNRGIVMLRIHGPGVGCQPGVIGRIGRRLAEGGINIQAVITSQTCINLLLGRADGRRAAELAAQAANGTIRRFELREDVALIAAVGGDILRTPGVAARIFSAVAKAGINVDLLSAGASDAAAYFIIREADAARAVEALHAEFFG